MLGWCCACAEPFATDGRMPRDAMDVRECVVTGTANWDFELRLGLPYLVEDYWLWHWLWWLFRAWIPCYLDPCPTWRCSLLLNKRIVVPDNDLHGIAKMFEGPQFSVVRTDGHNAHIHRAKRGGGLCKLEKSFQQLVVLEKSACYKRVSWVF